MLCGWRKLAREFNPMKGSGDDMMNENSRDNLFAF